MASAQQQTLASAPLATSLATEEPALDTLPDAPSAMLQEQSGQSQIGQDQSNQDQSNQDQSNQDQKNQNGGSVTVTAPPMSRPHVMRQDKSRKGNVNSCNYADPTCPPNNRQPFLNSRSPNPILTPLDKLILAGRNFSDPFNLALIGISTGAFVASNSHSAYGPGFKGWGKNFGVGVTSSLQGEFFGTFAIPVLTHEDPRYHRMPGASMKKRLIHAFSRTLIAQSDHGHNMPNYSVLLGYPIGTELANAYVPGIQRDAKSTGMRIVVGYATNPINDLLTEFLPDVAKRIHVRGAIFQGILNKIATDPMNGP